MEKCDRCGEAPAIMGTLERRDGRKLCTGCIEILDDGTALVGTARIPIFAQAAS